MDHDISCFLLNLRVYSCPYMQFWEYEVALNPYTLGSSSSSCASASSSSLPNVLDIQMEERKHYLFREIQYFPHHTISLLTSTLQNFEVTIVSHKPEIFMYLKEQLIVTEVNETKECKAKEGVLHSKKMKKHKSSWNYGLFVCSYACNIYKLIKFYENIIIFIPNKVL